MHVCTTWIGDVGFRYLTLSTQLTEDRLRHANGPVQPSVPLHLYSQLMPTTRLGRFITNAIKGVSTKPIIGPLHTLIALLR